MNGQRHATVVAASTLALTLTPLIGIFDGLGWAFPVMLTITMIAVSGSLMRAAGRGQGLQTLAMSAALVVVLTAGFGDGTGLLFIVPLPATFAHWAVLAQEGVSAIIVNAPPVEATGGIMFLTILGVGVVAILHDMFVVGLRTPALAGLTLLTMYLVPVSVAPDATAWFWFILPAVAYLWILGDDNLRRVSSFGHRFTGTGQLVGRGFPSPLARTARWSAAGFVAVTLLALTLVPANTSGLIDNVADGIEGGGESYGMGDVNPWAQLSGSLNRPEEVDILRVTTDDPNPQYLKMHVLDELSSDGFAPNEYQGTDDLGDLDEPEGETYTAQIENLQLEASVVPVYGKPASLDIPGDWRVDPDTGVVVGDGGTDMGDVENYEVVYSEPAPDAETLAAADGMDPGDERWEANTAHPDVPELSGIVAAETDGLDTVHEKVLAIQAYLSAANGFSYSLETADAGNDEAILDFLETKQGYCQQYAAAMAWMLREADVAARVVVGMSQGTRLDGDQWLLTSHDYHAWVEVYYDGPGWVTFDPTPSSGVPGSVTFPWAREPTEEVDPSEEPSENDISPEPTAAPTDENGQTLPAEGATNAPGADPSDASDEALLPFHPGWFALLPLLAVPFLPALWRGSVRRRRLNVKHLTAATAWDEAMDLALDYGVSIPESYTPRQAAGVLATAAPGARDAANALGSAMALYRYSPRGADPGGLADALKDLYAELDKNSEPRVKYRAMFWPASLIAKFSADRAEQSARMARRSARTTDRMRSALRRPRRSNNRDRRGVGGRA
jgi:transglutaminase-like putative cysteine protease